MEEVKGEILIFFADLSCFPLRRQRVTGDPGDPG